MIYIVSSGLTGIAAAQHLRNCPDLEQFREFYGDCPNARAAARELILLPTYPAYPLSEIQQNIKTIQRFFSIQAAQGLQKASQPL
jgi:perosamine synthetase